MDKKQLNDEIILCRPLVKRAKVCVVRKLLKQVKILRSCKNEETKEKKFRKASRLIAEIHAMKTLRADYVTKFLLVMENYVFAGNNTKLKRKRNACAKLAKHWDLMARINAIRNKFVNWREQLPLMLKSAKKKAKVANESKTENDEVDAGSEKGNDENNVNPSAGEEDEDEDNGISDTKVNERIVTEEELVSESSEGSKSESQKPKISRSLPVLKIPKTDCVKTKLNMGVKKTKEIENLRGEGEGPVKNKTENFKKETEEHDEERGNRHTEIEKMDDPFFLGKKVIVPNLLQKGNENNLEREKIRKRELNDDVEQEFRPRKKSNVVDESGEKMGKKKDGRKDGVGMGKRMKKNEACRKPLAEEDLHPSWKAKKMQTIKPFQGKKIVFD